MPDLIPLGPFGVECIIGRGGMAQVWRGRHLDSNTPVALKFVTAEKARKQRYLRGFQREVESVARLDHPSIITVFDYGRTPRAFVADDQQSVQAGVPYLVMELAESGTLSRQRDHPLSWSDTRTLLLEILGALAHAHARGVVHRDLKPDNLLLTREAQGGVRVKLSDFGLASPSDDTASTPLVAERIAGTPNYMAPEQIRGRPRDQGPWTDLYAVGCLAYKMIVGRPPFAGASIEDTLRGHLQFAPPRLPKDADLPEALQQWLDRLLAKEPARRFRRAADAAWALDRLGGQHVASGTTPGPLTGVIDISGLPSRVLPKDQQDTFAKGPTNGSAPTDSGQSAADQLVFDSESTSQMTSLTVAELATRVDLQPNEKPLDGFAKTGLGETIRPDCPETWHRPDPPGPSVDLLGAGLGLFGLRRVSLVDRRDERDMIWAALRESIDTDTPRLVALEGPAGTGKSEVARWMAQRTHEVGAATILKATHSARGGPADGLRPMLARHLRCVGLDRSQIAIQVERRLAHLCKDGVSDAYEATALTDLLAAPGTDPGQTHRRLSPSEQHATLRRYVERLCRQRPVFLWVDDAQWAESALTFARSLLEEDLPIVFVLTVRSDLLADRPIERDQLEALLALDRARECPTGPLTSADHRELVSRLLGLEDDLARTVASRTDGRPLFAVQLVGDWVERGILVVGDKGFELAAGASAAVPADIHNLWNQRVDRLLEVFSGRSAEDLHSSLELAACLGREINGEEWRDACALLGLADSDALVDAMVQRRMAVRRVDGWSFAHGLFQESLEDSAQRSDRYIRFQRGCAHMLRQRYPDTRHAGILERIGRHFYSARDLEKCLEPLLEAAYIEYSFGRNQHTEELLVVCEDAAEQLAGEGRDAWARITILKARLATVQGEMERAAAQLREAEDYCGPNAAPATRAKLLSASALLARNHNQHEEAIGHLTKAAQLYRQARDNYALADAFSNIGDLHIQLGEFDEAENHMRLAYELWQDSSDPVSTGRTLYGLARLKSYRGDLDEAWSLAYEALPFFEKVGHTYGIAKAHEMLGHIRHEQGRLGDALVQHNTELRLLESINHVDAGTTRLFLGMIHIDREEPEQADAYLRRAYGAFRERDKLSHVGTSRAVMTASSALLGDWESVERHLHRAVAVLAEVEYETEKIGVYATRAAQLARRAGQTDLARKLVVELAIPQWQGLGVGDKLQHAEQLLAELDDSHA